VVMCCVVLYCVVMCCVVMCCVVLCCVVMCCVVLCCDVLCCVAEAHTAHWCVCVRECVKCCSDGFGVTSAQAACTATIDCTALSGLA